MTSEHIDIGTTILNNKQNQPSRIACLESNALMVAQDQNLNTAHESNNKSSKIDVEEWTIDDTSSISSNSTRNTIEKDDCASENGIEIVPQDDGQLGTFGNIVVKNSSDVQFGNNTYYQGPVTIKQFVYKSVDDKPLCLENGNDNLAFESNCDKDEKFPQTTEKNLDLNQEEKQSMRENISTHWLLKIYQRKKLYSIILSLLLIITLILLLVFLLKKYQNISNPNGFIQDSDELENNTPIDPSLDPSNVTLSGKLRLIPRLEWLAQPPSSPASPLKHPVPYVIILHTATENCSDQATCVFHVRYIQTFHMESKGWWDIGYNFLVGGDGFAYVGRGWDAEGAHTYGYNIKSIGIAFIGTFINIMPPERQIKAAKQLIELGVKKGYIAENYKLLAHRQLSSTQSPGEILYENIKIWPHWSATP